MQTVIRADGKPAKLSRGGTPPGSPRLPSSKNKGGSAPEWHVLVKPGPKGNPLATYQRREDLGQLIHHEPYRIEQSSAYLGDRRTRRIHARNRHVIGGNAVLHNGRMKPLRGAERAAHRAAVTVDHEMTGGNTVRRAPVQILSKQKRRAIRQGGKTQKMRGLIPTNVILDEVQMLEEL